MHYPFLPEGQLLSTQENVETCAQILRLLRAGFDGKILEGLVLMATPDHDLLVRCGAFVGRMPRREAALSISDDKTHDISVLSLVGKPICFTVIGWEEWEESPRPILSRRNVQARAKAWLDELPPGTVIPAVVTHLEQYGAFLDVGCGIPSMLSIQRICVSRIAHPSAHLTLGQLLWVVVLGHDLQKGHLLVSHKELLGTWMQNAALYAQGMTVPGIVRTIHDYGAFIELTPNLSGLALCRFPVVPDERVSVYIKAIIPQRMKIKLTLIDRLPSVPPTPFSYCLPDSGRMACWHYATPGCEKYGGETVFYEPET